MNYIGRANVIDAFFFLFLTSFFFETQYNADVYNTYTLTRMNIHANTLLYEHLQKTDPT